jgi:BirA family biotin operon repressor/biotin-[acetyl-CoA-carboxylase] ligase
MPIKDLWESYAISLGQVIKASTVNDMIVGKALGITDSGVLLLEDGKGTVHSIYSADIEIQ